MRQNLMAYYEAGNAPPTQDELKQLASGYERYGYASYEV